MDLQVYLWDIPGFQTTYTARFNLDGRAYDVCVKDGSLEPLMDILDALIRALTK